MLPALQSNPSVEFAEPNFIITADGAGTQPNDPRFPDQWALGSAGGVNAGRSWRQTTGSKSTLIAVIDSGVDFTHHELRDSRWTNPKEKAIGSGADLDNYKGDVHGWDWVANSPGPTDESGHGTAVAGVIAATGNNGEGLTGVMWRASLMSLRVLDKENKGSVSDAVEAIDYAVAKGAHVINCSWGLDEASVALREALKRAVISNVTVVCSAGNGGHDLQQSARYPASYEIPFVISVASSGRTDELTITSNWGAKHVAVAAPGEELLTTKAGGGYETFSGTSAAAAIVSGVAGLVRTLRPRLSAERTQQMILVGARKVSALEDRVMSNGVVDVPGALAAFRLLQPSEGLDDGDTNAGPGAGGDGTRDGTAAEGNVTAAEKLKALPPGLRQSYAYDLPNLDSARRLPRGDPRAIAPVPSTRRRCPPHDRRCNDTVDRGPQPITTPTPLPKSEWRGNPHSLASASTLSLLAVLKAAMNGGQPLIGVPLFDYYSSGSYSVSDSSVGPLGEPTRVGTQPVSLFQSSATLVAQWKFDDGSGTAAADSSGNGNTGTLQSGPVWSAGTVGTGGLDFDGADDRVTVASSATIGSVFNNFTVSFWAYPRSTHEIDLESTSGAGGVYGQKYVWGPLWGGASDAGAGVSVGTNGVSVYEHGDGYMPAPLVYQGPITGWTHIAVVYQNKQPKLYINGTLVRTGLTSPRANVRINPADIGGMAYGYFNGQLDDLRIYNGMLTLSEIAELASPPVQLMAHWKFDEGTGTTAADSTGRGNTGTLSGASWAAGKVGAGAVNFNGTSNSVSVASAQSLQALTNDFAISFWANPRSSHEIDAENTWGADGVSGERYAFGPLNQGTEAGAGVSVGTNGVSVYEHASGYMPARIVYQAPISGWTHVAVVYAGRQPKLYINGVLVKTGGVSPMSVVRVAPWNLGGNVYGYYDGYLDDVRVYKGSLSSQEVSALAGGQGSGLTGKYYDNDDFTAYKLTRSDATVNFDWGNGSPDPSMGGDFFTVRWIGTVVPRYSETYTFSTTTDDGVRLWIDGQMVIDKWVDQAPTEWTGQIALQAGRAYSIRMEFYEHWGGATAKLQWSSASQAKEVVPQGQLYGCWKGADQFARDFYQGALARQPLAAEFNEWTTRFIQAQGDAQLVAQAQALGAHLFNSTEYANRNRSDQDYVSDLYWAYLQRVPDQGGLNFWTGQITQCGSDQSCRAQKREDVRSAFDQSGEFQEKVRGLCGTSAAADANSGVGYDFSTARLDPDNRTAAGGADPLSRNFNWSVPLVSLPGRAGLDLGLSLSYNSLVWTKDATGVTFDADEGFPGPGFRLGFPVIQPKFFNPKTEKYAYLLITPSGGHAELRQIGTSNVYESADSSYLQLTDSGGLTLLSTDGTRLTFYLLSGQYRCNQIKDRNGNYISVSYYSDGRIDKVIDTLGRTITFNYDAFQNIISITQPWKRETAASPTGVDETHTWATFGYTNLTLQPSFSNLAVMGDQPGSVIPVITQVGLDDGSYYKFSYNQWGQIWKVTHYAADSVVGGVPQDTHALSYSRLNLPGSDLQSATPQTDCPRFTTQGTWIENGVMNQSAEPTTSYSAWTPSMASCDITPPDPTPTVSTDNVVYRETYVTSGWQKGLPTSTKVLVNGTQRKWTDITWTQDDTNATYQINPRIIDTTVHDSENHHRRSSTSYYTFTLPSGVSCSLPQDVTSYQANTTTPLRTTRIEYNVSTDYTSRRIIGLPSFTYTYEGGISAANLRSKVGYLYDEPSNLSDTFLGSLPSSATQHDGTNYGTGFIWRGNANRLRKYEVNQLSGALSGNYLESRVGYKVTGSVAYAKDGLGHVTTTSYTDSFFQSVNRSNPSLQTFAYPTTVTDPDNFSATTAYNYDMGVMTQSTDPKNAIMKTRYDTAGRPERITRRDGVNSVDKGYTSLVYPASMNLVQTYMLTDATKPEAYSVKVLDGAGRVRATAAEHLGSTGGYAAQIFDFDAAGQIARQSKPTETNASGGTWAALGDDDPTNGGSGWVYTVQAYDWKGRPTVTTNTADSTSRTISYDGCGCAGGEVSTLTDEVGNRQRMTADILGRQFKVEDLNTDASVYRTTTTTYNARDQITQSVDQEGTSGTAQTTTTEYDGYGRVWKTRPPQANASTVFAYNADDSVNVQTDARGATATYSYNNRGMTTGVTYALSSDVWSVSFGYDSAGNRTSMTDGMGPVSYTYDTVSRLTSETRTFTETARSFTTAYQYNLADELTLVTDHFGASVTYTRDRTGRLTDMPGYTTGMKYRAWGVLKEQTHTNGKVVSMGYDARMRMTQFNVPGITGWQYQYYGDGNLQFSSNLQTLGTRDERLDRKLVYDHVGRLWQGFSGSQARGEATFPATGPYKQNLSNDVWDHLTFRDNLRGSVYNSYSAIYVNNKNQNTGWQYDANGSLTRTQEGTSITQYTYNCASHLTSAVMATSSSNTTILYGYDGDGQRVKKIETSAPTTYYVRSAALGGQVLDEVDASGGKLRGYVYQEGKIIAKQEGAGTQWDVRDPANNSNFMLDASGASVSHIELDPLGTTVDPNNPSYSQNPMGFYGGPGLQGTYCRVNNLGISVPCSLAQMLNRTNFGATVTVNGDQMPLTMAMAMAEIGWMGITQQDILFGNPWDLQNMRLTFREPTHYKAGVVGVGGGPAPPQITGSSRPSLRDYYFNWGAYAAGYLWMDGYGADHPTEGHDAVVKGAFVRSPQGPLFTTEELVAGARDIIENAAAPCAKLLGKNALAKFDKISGNITFNGDAPIIVDNGGGPQGARLGSVGYIDAVTNGQTVSLNPNGNTFNNVSKGGSGTHFLQGVFDKFGVTQRQFAIAVIIHEFLHTTGKFGKDYKLKPDGTIDASKSVRNQEQVLKDCFPP